MRRYATYSAALIVLVLATWLIFFSDSSSRRVPGGPKSTATAAMPASTDVPSAWTLLTADDLKQLTGGDYVGRDSQAELEFLKSCAYTGPQDVSLTIVIGSGAPFRYETIRQFPHHVPQADLGDEAIWVPSNGILAVHAGEVTLQIEIGQDMSVGEEVADRQLSIARAIADHVLERLAENTQGPAS